MMSGLEQSSNMGHAISHIDRMWISMQQQLSRLKESVHWQEKWKKTKCYAQEHPIMTMFGVITVAMFSLPISCFFAFACGSMMITFMGFMFIEGFLLSIAGLLLGGALFFVGFLSLSISSLLAAAWYTAYKGQSILTSVQHRIRQSAEPAHREYPEKDEGSEKEKQHESSNGC